jgi:hypothetical protein
MAFWLFLLLTVLLIIGILFPPFFFVVIGCGLFYLWLYLDHVKGAPFPFWVWGEKPEHSVRIKWWTTQSYDVYLEYSVLARTEWIRIQDSYHEQQVSLPDSVKVVPSSRHVFIIDDLNPATEYRYRICDANTHHVLFQHRSARFHTQATRSPPQVKFVVCGDMQISDPAAALETYMISKIRREKADFILFMGDHVHSYKNGSLWHGFFRIMRKLMMTTPFYPIIGNHCGGDGGEIAGKIFLLAPDPMKPRETLWNYSWRFGAIRFIAVNSLPLLNQDWGQVHTIETWLEYQLANTPPDVDFTFIYMHVPWIGPPYNQAGTISFYETYLAENWAPLLEKYSNRVSAVFAGHKHSYVRQGKYFISASIHGVRKYPEIKNSDYVVRNSHHYLVVQGNQNSLRIQAKLWTNQIWDEIEILKKPE